MKAVLARTNFENADLSDALMDRAVIVEANLKGAILQVPGRPARCGRSAVPAECCVRWLGCAAARQAGQARAAGPWETPAADGHGGTPAGASSTGAECVGGPATKAPFVLNKGSPPCDRLCATRACSCSAALAPPSCCSAPC